MRFAVFVPKGQTFMESLSLFLRLNLLPKRLSSLAGFFRAKTLIVREMRFAGFAPKILSYAMVCRHLQRLVYVY